MGAAPEHDTVWGDADFGEGLRGLVEDEVGPYTLDAPSGWLGSGCNPKGGKGEKAALAV